MRKWSLVLVFFLPLKAFACPQGYAVVPADNVYTTEDYCLSEREIQKDGAPWHLAHYPAKKECWKIGRELPSNDLWQALARNAEKQPANWQNGYMKTSVTLSNGAIFYNVGDSVWEQIEYRLDKDPHINGLKIEQLPDKQGFFCRMIGLGCGRTPKELFGPSGVYPDARLGFTTTYYKGNPYIMRGGDDQSPGLFGVAMNHGPDADSNGDDVGFRCACPARVCK